MGQGTLRSVQISADIFDHRVKFFDYVIFAGNLLCKRTGGAASGQSQNQHPDEKLTSSAGYHCVTVRSFFHPALESPQRP